MQHQTVSREQWIAARQQLLAQEKQLTRMRDQVAAQRRELADLFDGRSQLVVRHFMFGPGWGEGCVGCSFWADHLDGALVHLAHRDVTVVVVSRAPFAEIEAFRKRMGWRFKWVSSYGSDFNYDYDVSFTPDQLAAGNVNYNYAATANAGEEMPGLSVFHKNADGTTAHTYSSYARGNEPMLGTYTILDLTPNGRNETGSRGNLTDWVRLHDRYDEESGACCATD
jgi:predicted dithiol-disulfide oxidoreductase (DUF899 family)